MAKEGVASETTSLVRRATATPGRRVGAAGLAAGGGTALVLGGIAAEPSVAHLMGMAVSTGEGVSVIAGVGAGLAASGIAAITTKDHWVSRHTSETECGVINTAKSKEIEYGTYYRCEHDGSARRSALRRIGAYSVVIGGAVAGVGAAALGAEHAVAQVAVEIGSAVGAGGAAAAAASLLVRHRGRQIGG